MKERPILFSAPMVRAILDGRKMQTRRVVKYRVIPRSDSGMLDFWRLAVGRAARWVGALLKGEGTALKLCPYGAVGDRLWVRETWAGGITADSASVDYRADGKEYGTDCDGVPLIRWRPSIHMPRWASRITLEVTGVRVERLQDISYEDACAEGCAMENMRFEPVGDGETWEQTSRRLQWPQRSYAQLWESINGADSWAANPFCWVIEFKRVSQ